MLGIRYLKAAPTTYVIQHVAGAVKREGPGLSFFYYAPGSTLVAVPLATMMIAFAIANRQWVTVSADPFSSTNPAYAADMPLFAIIFAAVIFGVLIGGFTAWRGQTKWRRSARRLVALVPGAG